MNARWHLVTRPSTYALAGCSAVTVALVGVTLASCNDPTGFNTSSVQSPNTVVGPVNYNDAQPPAVAAFGIANQINEDCPAGSDWIPADGGPPPPVRMFTPPPHPDTECPFYRGAYQNFLIATDPLGSAAGPGQQASDPALVNYPTIDDAFVSTIPHLQRNTGDPSANPHTLAVTDPPSGRAWLGAVRQAGQRNILIDQDDHTLYYGLHMNLAFYNFIKANGLDTPQGILNVNPYLSFPPGLVEFKTAWKDIDPADFPQGVPDPPEGDFGPGSMYAIPGVPYSKPTWDANYITTMAWVPHLTQDPSTGIVSEDRNHPFLRKVALVAIHCVYTLPGHPEFVWGSIQHVNINAYDPATIAYAGAYVQGAPDSQPNNVGPGGMAVLPGINDPQNQSSPGAQLPASTNDYLLYKGGTLIKNADIPIPTNMLQFVESSQSFPGQGAQESVYRMFPGSKSSVLSPDTAVFSLNSNIGYAFSQAIAGGLDTTIDKRQNYRLVAATWMDKPYFFGLSYPGIPLFGDPPGVTFQNDSTNPMIIGVCGSQTAGSTTCQPPNPINLYPNVSQGITCGTPLDSTDTSGDSPNANGLNNAVPGCPTRADDIMNGDNPLQLYNTAQVDTDYEFSLTAGEDRLSSTAMETFTQNNGFRNCFTCHNTQPINTNGTPLQPGDTPLLTRPAMINVSHLFSEFILRDNEEIANAGDAGAGH